MPSIKPKANWYTCSDHVDYHDMRDYCSSCAPFWNNVPLCPTHNKKLKPSGYCKPCKKFYDLNR